MEFLEGLQAIYDFLVVGSYTFVQEILAELIIWVVTWWFKLKVAALQFMWGIAAAMIDQLNISATLNAHWSQLDSGLLGFITRYNVPEAVNLLLNAYITRFIWSLL